MKQQFTRGSIHPSTIMIVVLTILFIGAGAFGVWSYMQYREAKTDVDGQIDAAVAIAKKEQAIEDEVKIQAAKENPYSQFVGPDDYGRVTFEYPRNWSVYEASDVSSGRGTYKAYLNPTFVPLISKSDNRYALRVTIEDKQYETVLRSYESRVEKGDLRSQSFTVDDQTGTRIDGEFSSKIRGAMVIFKIRDKTLTIQTDADTFKPKFDEIVKTIQFNK
jgi:hypothetical protein